jgi:predicted dienelactone hydrolase
MIDTLWIDSSRGERQTKNPADKRHLMIQIWYPAEVAEGAETVKYIGKPEEFNNLPAFRPVLHVRTNAVAGAPLARGEARYPVLLYNHGGSWTRFSATFTTEMLASHGYVVVSVDHTGFNKSVLFPDGYRYQADTLTMPVPKPGNFRATIDENWDYLGNEVFPTWVADARFALDRVEQLNRAAGLFQGRLDLDRIGALGWSFGGATAVQLTQEDPRVKAAVDQDGQLFGVVRERGSTRPVMLMHNDSDPTRQVPDSLRSFMAEAVAKVRGFDSTFRARTQADWYTVTIARTGHGHFSDLTLFFPRDTSQMEPRRAHQIINAYTLAFFDTYLRGKPSPLLAGPSPDHPEVTFRKR